MALPVLLSLLGIAPAGTGDMLAGAAGVLLIAAAGLAIDGIIGDPQRLWKRTGHPIQWIGGLIGRLDNRLNPPPGAEAAGQAPSPGSAGRAIVTGGVALAGVVAAMIGAGLLLALGLAFLPAPLAWAVEAGLVAILLAGRGLYRAVRRVLRPLGPLAVKEDEAEATTQPADLAAGRRALSHLVGRETADMDAPALRAAAIESLAENFSDGLVAPILWYLVAGLPGLLAYKAINTADSMIGHRSPRHRHFGRVAARVDDAVNWPAARLAAGLILVMAVLQPDLKARRALACLRHQPRHHRSPNAGWPEAALAGAIGIRLGGPRVYHGVRHDEPWMGTGQLPTAQEGWRALALYRACCFLLGTILALGGVVLLRGVLLIP